MRAWLVAALIVCSAAAPAGAARSGLHHGALRSYMAKVAVQIRGYAALGKRAERVFNLDPTEGAAAIADGLTDVSVRFDRLAAHWDAVKAPPGLGLKHRGMGGAFRLQVHFFAVFAEAWSQYAASGDPAVLSDLSERTAGLARSAMYLQNRWAVALRGALIRASLPVPRWLQQMTTIVP